ncbi:MAG TPA: four helix bundle protein [Holophagaceae bacterium]|nr:four helix bundle protein [Holophagaceae bacterium]
MFRDTSKLKVFTLADELAVSVHRATVAAPDSLGAQLRRASVLPPLAIQEGCAQWKDEAFIQCLGRARGAATELRYLLGLAGRVGLLGPEARPLEEQAFHLVKALQLLLKAQNERGRQKKEAGPKDV